MKKILFNFLYILVTLLSLAAIYLFFIFNPNDYKEHITKHISSKAKYDVIINGDIKVSYYPDIKVLIPDIEVFNIPSNPYKQTITSSKNMKIEISLIDLSLSLEKLMNKMIDINYVRAYEFKYHGIDIDDVLMKTYAYGLNNYRDKDVINDGNAINYLKNRENNFVEIYNKYVDFFPSNEVSLSDEIYDFSISVGVNTPSNLKNYFKKYQEQNLKPYYDSDFSYYSVDFSKWILPNFFYQTRFLKRYHF